MTNSFDVVVIGAGPGGYVAAIRAAQNGLKTAIVERDRKLGGTCLLRGCIPTKALLHSADLLEQVRHAADFGINIEGHSLDFGKVMKRKERVVAKLTAGVAGLMKKNGIAVFQGHGRLTGPGRLEVEGGEGAAPQQLEAKNIILATGSEVRDLPVAPPDHQRVLTSDSILKLETPPKSLIVMGAGAVGMEFASIFATFGVEVTIVELLPRLLPIEDEEISAEMEKLYKRRKIEVLTGTKVERVEKSETGVRVTVSNAQGAQEREAEMLLVAVGRKPVTERLGLETVGLELERGFIPVDARMRTRVPGIWAIGDLVPTLALAHVASHEAMVAADDIAGKNPGPVHYGRVPSATYTWPEVASVGLTEQKAKEKGFEVKVGRFPFAAIGKATIAGEVDGFVKIVSDAKYDEVLGVHIVGPKATELIAEGCAALQLEATTADLVETIHAHPTLAESMGEAAHAVLGHTINF